MKTIKLTVSFFANGLPEKVGEKEDKTPMWQSGQVYLRENKDKELEPEAEFFTSFKDIPRAMEVVLRKAKVVAIKEFKSKK